MIENLNQERNRNSSNSFRQHLSAILQIKLYAERGSGQISTTREMTIHLLNSLGLQRTELKHDLPVNIITTQ